MEADISCIEVIDDNKENIPPNSSFKEIVLQLQDCKLPAANGGKFKRKFRRPLTDITNLFVVGQSDLSILSSAALNCRKRKALAAASDDHIDIDWKHKISSKILRTGFR